MPIAARIRGLAIKAGLHPRSRHTAALPSVTTPNLYYTCNIIAWRFQLNTTPRPVRGINLLVINSAKQIETIYDELNSGAFLYHVGRPECQANWTVSVAS